jgi:hypothetical protein
VPLYVVEIEGYHPMSGGCIAGQTSYYAHPEPSKARDLVKVMRPIVPSVPALFDSKDAANEIGRLICNTGQVHVVKPARGNARRDGILVTVLRGTARKVGRK